MDPILPDQYWSNLVTFLFGTKQNDDHVFCLAIQALSKTELVEELCFYAAKSEDWEGCTFLHTSSRCLNIRLNACTHLRRLHAAWPMFCSMKVRMPYCKATDFHHINQLLCLFSVIMLDGDA